MGLFVGMCFFCVGWFVDDFFKARVVSEVYSSVVGVVLVVIVGRWWAWCWWL